VGEIFRLEKAVESLQFSGERFTSEAVGQIEVEHLHRYFLAREICRDKDVLDVASGEAYGTAMLSQVAQPAVGVEIDAATVAHAQRSYSRNNLRFLCGDARAIPLPDKSVDVVISFETLEHLAEHEIFLHEIKRVLRPGGLAVISTPDRDVY
jgi:SAM-dependent methyltransferase